MNREGPWVALSCGLLRNRKLRRVSSSARLLYIAGLLHCGDELTDGEIELAALPALLLESGARRPTVSELEDAGLWHELEGGGWEINGYLDWNLSRADWERNRAANARRQAAYRARQERESSTNAARTLHEHDTDSEPAGDKTSLGINKRKSVTKPQIGKGNAESNALRDASRDPVTNGAEEKRERDKSLSPKGTGSRENGQGLTAPSLLVESLRLELERLTGPDGVPV